MTDDRSRPPTNRQISAARTARAGSLGMLGSVLLHVAAITGMVAYTSAPDVGLEFHVPSEMEFGVADGMEVEATAAAEAAAAEQAAQAEAAAQAAAEAAAEGASSDALDAGVRPHRDAGTRASADAGVADAAVANAAVANADAGGAGDAGDRDASSDAGDQDASADAAEASPDAGPGVRDAGRPLPPVARATEGRSRMGPGGDIALRLDLTRVRNTPLELTIGQFLGSVRDFQVVLGGSGIDVVRDMEQFLMGSPDPIDRQRYHYVGRLAHDEDWARARVAEIAATHGSTAEWTEIDGIPVAPWRDGDDATAHRVLALLGDRYFVLCRANELPRMRAWLAHIAETAGRPPEDGPALALGVADDEVISLEMENMRAYMQGDPAIVATLPSRGRLSIMRASDRLELAFRGDFPNADEAVAGADHWNVERERAASNPLVRFGGFGRVLGELVLAPDDEVVRARTELTVPQVQTMVGLAQVKLQETYDRWDRGR